jgi:hypothetical protein
MAGAVMIKPQAKIVLLSDAAAERDRQAEERAAEIDRVHVDMLAILDCMRMTHCGEDLEGARLWLIDRMQERLQVLDTLVSAR